MGPLAVRPSPSRQGLIAMSDFQEDELLAAWETQSETESELCRWFLLETLRKMKVESNRCSIYIYDLWCFLVFSVSGAHFRLKKKLT